MGVKELSTPVSPLSRPVSAIANKKAGNKLAVSPTIKRNLYCFKFMDFNLGRAIGANTIKAKIILSAPTCPAEKPIRAFLINIKELPQIIERVANIMIDKYFGFFNILLIYKLKSRKV